MTSMDMSGINTSGFFGPVTATLEWCEANYQFSYYIAEMANSFSNFFTMFLSLYGIYTSHREELPFRFVIAFAGIGLVAVGSFAFHASMLYETQMADELPMIYVGALSIWHLYDCSPGFSVNTARARSSLIALLAFDILFTWSYFSYRNPVYHQAVFASLIFSLAFRITYLLKWSEYSSRVPEKQNALITRIFAMGAGMFAFGFFIWNLDNIFCHVLTKWKVAIGWPVAFLLEGHSWWHIFTGLGTYYMSIGIQLPYSSKTTTAISPSDTASAVSHSLNASTKTCGSSFSQKTVYTSSSTLEIDIGSTTFSFTYNSLSKM